MAWVFLWSMRLSDWLRLKIYRNGEVHQMEFQAWCTSFTFSSNGQNRKKGTEVHFLASTETFVLVNIHFEILAKRIRELSFLNNGVKIELIDQRNGKSENFAYSGGIKGFVEYMNRSKTVLHPKTVLCHGRKRRHDHRSFHAMER
jgi:DNA gyrase subunit B